MKFNFILYYLLILNSNYYFSQSNNIQDYINVMLNDEKFINANVSFTIFDIDSNKIIAGFDSHKNLVPASNQKILTTAAAIDILGSDYTFNTKVYYSGIIDTINKILFGDIIIKGNNDPTLGSKYFDNNEINFIDKWIDILKHNNIDSINGKIIIDNSLYERTIPDKWSWEDIGQYYGAIPQPISIYDNIRNLCFNSPKNENEDTELIDYYPYLPEIQFINNVKSSNIPKDLAYVYTTPYYDLYEIKGTIPKNKSKFIVKSANMQPSKQLAFDFINKLFEYNIGLKDKNYFYNENYINNDQIITLIINHKSPKLFEICKMINQNSVNLFAEHLFIEIGLQKLKSSNYESISIFIENYFQQKYNLNTINISDGSGLSRANLISSFNLTTILANISKENYFVDFYNTLPIAGVNGTISNMFHKSYAYNNLRAKSGTLENVKAYSGFVTSKSNRKLAFSLIVNNYFSKKNNINKNMEELMMQISNY